MDDTPSPLTLLARAPGAALKQARRILATRYYRRCFHNRPDHPALDADRGAAVVSDADSLLFCCWGNICRSPMAERYLRETLDGTESGDITVRSAGLGERSGRPSPPTAVEAAARYGVDLSDHRSSCANPAMVEQSDAVFVMDFHTYHLLQSLHPSPEPVFFLSTFSDEGIEIPDPAGKSRQTFDRVYATIVTAVDRLAAILQSSNEPRTRA